MARRRRMPDDTRPKWDDPDLRCAVGRGEKRLGFSAEVVSRVCSVNLNDPRKPYWRYDLAYFWGQRREK